MPTEALQSVPSSEVIESHACETSFPCDLQATVMVWCDHHIKGCDYTGFRCDVHFNLLYQETLRQIDSIRQGWLSICANCALVMEDGPISDHLRWIRL